jgi:peptide/nickel transport system substrate-binding protein
MRHTLAEAGARAWHRWRLAIRGTRLRHRAMVAVAAGAACALVAAGCSSSGSPAVGSTPVSGGTAVFAEAPSATPNYIFPYVSSTFISDINIFDLQYLLYRPLYWFGNGAQPTLNRSLSLADPPAFNGTSAQLPMIWQPNADYQLNEIADNLKGVTPLSTTLSINPENWYFTK